MRGAEAGDMYLHYLDQAVRCEDEGEHRALCRAMLESALADLWCVPMRDRHGVTIDRLAYLRREPSNGQQRRNRRNAIAWINGETGTAEEPLRWVDVCEALGLDARTTRRAVLQMRVSQRRESEDGVAWRTVAVSA